MKVLDRYDTDLSDEFGGCVFAHLGHKTITLWGGHTTARPEQYSLFCGYYRLFLRQV